MKIYSYNKINLVLASIFALRMFALFSLLPIIALHAQDLKSYSPIALGFAIGAYGLTQAFFQIPFGMLSDKFGRKKLLIIGLILFTLGTFGVAFSENMTSLTLSRIIQGSGAIASVLLAFVADVTPLEKQSRYMAIIGISIAITFSLSLAFSPFLFGWLGFSNFMFGLALLCLIALIIVCVFLPATPISQSIHQSKVNFAKLLIDKQVLLLSLSAFVLHFILSSLFLMLPIHLLNFFPAEQHSLIYTPILLISFVLAFPLLGFAAKKRNNKNLLLISILVLGFSLVLLSFNASFILILLGLFLFFSAFNLIEASLPALISMYSPMQQKGSCMGIFSTFQFLGAFLGAFVTGIILEYANYTIVLLLLCALSIIWFYLAHYLKNLSGIRVLYFKTSYDNYIKAKNIKTHGLLELIFFKETATIAAKVKIDSFNKKQFEELYTK